MAAHASRKKYWVVFVVLAVLTIIEILLAKIPGMRSFVIAGLIGLAVAKAGCVMMWYMHLNDETSVLKQTVILPFLFPVLYALVLIGEAFHRSGFAAFTWPIG